MILVGELSLWVALLMAAWSTITSFTGGSLGRADLIASGRRGLHAASAMLTLASIGLVDALLTHDFSLAYVAAHTTANMPKVYVLAAFWGGQAGSMLLWSLILAVYSSLAIGSLRNSGRQHAPWAAGTLAAILLFFIAMTCFATNPFDHLAFVPPDGAGLNPELQNPGMAVHPPALYLGYIATVIPFAFAIAALITGRFDAAWLVIIRRWTTISWFFLTTGIVLGMWWAYRELGWGGYWGWDPVQNTSLLPWLTTTALLHSIILQEKRGMLRRWNVGLVAASFLLAMLGTTIARTGAIESIHSFVGSPTGVWFAAFFALFTGATIYLVSTRAGDGGPSLLAQGMVSRETALLGNNLVLVGIAFAILWGTLFPIISQWSHGERLIVSAPYFDAVTIPLGLLLLAMSGAGPLLAWRTSPGGRAGRVFMLPVFAGLLAGSVLVAVGMRSGHALVTFTLGTFVLAALVQEFVAGTHARRSIHGESVPLAAFRVVARNRRRYGGYIVHAGVVAMFAGFAGRAFSMDHEFQLKAGESRELTDPLGHRWHFTSQGVSSSETLNRLVTTVGLETFRDSARVGILSSEKRQHFDSNRLPLSEVSTEVAIESSALLDLYVVLHDVKDDGTAIVRVTFNPLVVWVWIGGLIMAVGGLTVMWPSVAVGTQGDA